MDVPDLQTKRWTRYGKDRIYVSDEEGQRVGWLDLQDGQAHLEVPEHADAFQQALAPYRTPLPPVAAQPSAGAAAAAPAALQWLDLAQHRAGQLVRAEAEDRLAGMQARSRVGAFVARTLDLKTDERAYRVGAAGEEAVGRRLEKLHKHGWKVLHSIPVGQGDSDLDHLLIGPGGVFTVNTKNHPGKRVWVGQHVVKVDGHNTTYLVKARHETERATRLLSAAVSWQVPVKAVLVVLTGTVLPQVQVKQMPSDVLVLDRLDVPRIFRRAKRHLAEHQVQQVYEQARRSSTWRSSG